MTARPSSMGCETVRDTAPGALTAPGVRPAAVSTPVSPSFLLSLMREKCPEHDLTGPTSFAVHTLGREPRPVSSARRFVELTLRNWGLDAIGDDLAIITSELVTNALRYGLPARGRLTSPGQVWMGLARQGSTLLCAIFDPGRHVPVVHDSDPLAESGHGLRIVDALSDSWGWTTPDRSGKAVWALLSARGRV